MTAPDRLTDTLAARAAEGAGAAFAAGGVVQVVHPQHTGSDVVGLAGHLNLGFFVVALLLAAPALLALGRRIATGGACRAAAAAAAGTALLGVTCISSLVLGHDGPWFVVVAPITNAAWLFGSIALAVAGRRTGRLPGIVVAGLPVAWVATIPLATVGGGIVSGAVFLLTGAALGGRALSTPATVVAPEAV